MGGLVGRVWHWIGAGKFGIAPSSRVLVLDLSYVGRRLAWRLSTLCFGAVWDRCLAAK